MQKLKFHALHQNKKINQMTKLILLNAIPDFLSLFCRWIQCHHIFNTIFNYILKTIFNKIHPINTKNYNVSGLKENIKLNI